MIFRNLIVSLLLFARAVTGGNNETYTAKFPLAAGSPLALLLKNISSTFKRPPHRFSHRHFEQALYCPLFDLATLPAIHNDKYFSHNYCYTYCDIFQPLRRSNIGIRMLEIGFGCGHHNHGSSALLWKSYFSFLNGPGVKLWAIDYGPPLQELQACIRNFTTTWPGVIEKVYTGDQGNVDFINEVVRNTGGKFDIVVDDGAHNYRAQMPSFKTLWPQVIPGGYYVIEDLNTYIGVTSRTDNFVTVLVGWANQLAVGKSVLQEKNTWLDDQEPLPPDILSVRFENEVCVIRKKFKVPSTLSLRGP